MNRGHLRHSLLVELAVAAVWLAYLLWEQGGRRFKSSRPDHLKQGPVASAVSPFCFGLAVGLAFEWKPP